MSNETTRRSFFSALAFSPLALLGLRKKPDKPDLRVKLLCGEIEHYREISDHWHKFALAAMKENDRLMKVAEQNVKDADYWEGRALEAEFDLEIMGAAPLDEEWMKQLRLEEKEKGTSRTAEEIRDELRELRKGTA